MTQSNMYAVKHGGTRMHISHLCFPLALFYRPIALLPKPILSPGFSNPQENISGVVHARTEVRKKQYVVHARTEVRKKQYVVHARTEVKTQQS